MLTLIGILAQIIGVAIVIGVLEARYYYADREAEERTDQKRRQLDEGGRRRSG